MIIDKIKEEKERRNITNQELADQSGVPVGTIARIMARAVDSPNYTTVVSLCRALNISIDGYEGIEADGAPPQPVDQRTVRILENALNEKNRWIRTLFICCISLMGVIVFLLIFDIVNPSIGYVRY